MTNFKKGKLSFMRFGVAIPMVGAMILAFGACRAEAVNNTPTTPTPVVQNLPDEEKSTVYISADGKIMLAGEVVALDKFEKRYKAYLRKVGGGVFISFKADDNADIDLVNDVKDIINKEFDKTLKLILEGDKNNREISNKFYSIFNKGTFCLSS